MLRFVCPSYPLACIALLLAACGDGKDTSGDGSTSATAGTTTDGPTTTDDTTTDDATTDDTTTDDTTTGGPAGVCPSGWETPASAVVQLKIAAPDASVGAYDPDFVYPDGTAPLCIRWDGEALAGARVAFGPAVGDGPQALLEVVVHDGEREYGTSTWPPEGPDAYAGVSVIFILSADGEPPRTWDFAADQGIGTVIAQWVPRRTGEHVFLDGKLDVPGSGDGAQIGFTIDAVVAPASPPTEAFCAGLDNSYKCQTAGCAGWHAVEVVDDPGTCATTTRGACFAAFDSTGSASYDSAFYRVVDGETQLFRVGGEACESLGADFPAGWTECHGSPDDPPACVCACAGGVCPGDAALALLEACALPEPCPDVSGWGEVDATTYDCLFTAVATADPAVLRVHVNLGDPDWSDRVYLRGDGTASYLHGGCDVACIGSCEDRDWGVPRTCTLREPAYFADCAASEDLDVLTGCFDVSTWFTDCSVAPPTCP